MGGRGGARPPLASPVSHGPGKLGNIRKILNLGGQIASAQSSFKDLDFGNSSEKARKVHISNFSFPVQFCWVSPICSKYTKFVPNYTKNPQLFFELCRNELKHHAPKAKKYLRGNNKPFMTKVLSKSIMERTNLRNTFLKNPIVANKLAYTKQRKFSVSLLRKVKREYFANLNEKNITDNRKFWQTVKPFLSEKNESRGKKLW